MRYEPREGPRFPATCARCGGRIEEPVSFCPHCGTHARLAMGGERPPVSRETAPRGEGAELPVGDALWASRPTPLFATGFDSSYRDTRRAPVPEGGRQWGLKGGTALALVAFVVLYGGAVLLHRHDGASTPGQQGTQRMAEGTVQAGKGEASTQATDRRDAEARRAEAATNLAAITPAPPTAPNSAAMANMAATPSTSAGAQSAPAAAQPSAEARQAPQPAPSTPEPAKQASTKPAAPAPAIASIEPRASDSTGISVTQRDRSEPQSSHRSTAVAPVVVPPPKQTSEQQKSVAQRQSRQTLAAARAPSVASPSTKDEGRSERRQAAVAHSLAVAQDSLAKNNLSAARRALAAVEAAQPDNSEAFMLQRDLLSREQARDAALGTARTCFVEQRWSCAWHNAGSAMAIDSSSSEARSLVNRAMIESNAAGRPQPAQPAVPMLAEPGAPPAGGPARSAQTRPAAPAASAEMPPILGRASPPPTAVPTQTRAPTQDSNQPDVPLLTQ